MTNRFNFLCVMIIYCLFSLFKILLKRASLQNHFYLLGYETGVMVALEMAAILEKQGELPNKISHVTRTL